MFEPTFIIRAGRASGSFRSKLIPAVAARVAFMLPYYEAEMDFAGINDEFQFISCRAGSRSAEIRTRWRCGLRLRDPEQDSRTFFLVERYWLFAGGDEGMQMTRIYHRPWILDDAQVLSHESTMTHSLGSMDRAHDLWRIFERVECRHWPPVSVIA